MCKYVFTYVCIHTNIHIYISFNCRNPNQLVINILYNINIYIYMCAIILYNTIDTNTYNKYESYIYIHMYTYTYIYMYVSYIYIYPE